jgi:hypothetical protein
MSNFLLIMRLPERMKSIDKDEAPSSDLSYSMGGLA